MQNECGDKKEYGAKEAPNHCQGGMEQVWDADEGKTRKAVSAAKKNSNKRAAARL